MRIRRSIAAALFASSVAMAPIALTRTVLADDPPKADGGKPAAPDSKDKKDDAAAQTTRVERAKQMVKELEDAVARARAAQPVDAQLLLVLTQALEQARALAKPATPPELTPEEKKAVVDEAKRDAPPGDGAGKGGPGGDWAEKQLAKAFDGADLSEEEQIKAKKIIGDWFPEMQTAWGSGDSKKVSDLKRKRDDDLDKALGSKKARKVINNLDAMRPGRH